MVLDALLKIKREQDSTLTFRKSCREGVCGSCGINVDGKNCLACIKKIEPKGDSKIYPLPHMYVIKDLIVDFRQFIDQFNRIRPYLIRKNPEPIGEKQYLQSLKDRDNLVRNININFQKLINLEIFRMAMWNVSSVRVVPRLVLNIGGMAIVMIMTF